MLLLLWFSSWGPSRTVAHFAGRMAYEDGQGLRPSNLRVCFCHLAETNTAHYSVLRTRGKRHRMTAVLLPSSYCTAEQLQL